MAEICKSTKEKWTDHYSRRRNKPGMVSLYCL